LQTGLNGDHGYVSSNYRACHDAAMVIVIFATEINYFILFNALERQNQGGLKVTFSLVFSSYYV
jgi:hypothetical protein